MCIWFRRCFNSLVESNTLDASTQASYSASSFSGDLDYLTKHDVLKLRLPGLAEELVLQCIEQGICTAPLALDFGVSAKDLQMPIQVLTISDR